MTKIAVQPISDLEIAFGPQNLAALLPAWKDIPDEFKRGHTVWNRLVSAWFFSGVKDLQVTPKPGVDKDNALRHVKAVLNSFEPKHEHKEAGCAYLLSEWFSDPSWESARARDAVDPSATDPGTLTPRDEESR